LNISYNQDIDGSAPVDWTLLKDFVELNTFGIHGTSIPAETLDDIYTALPDVEVLY